MIDLARISRLALVLGLGGIAACAAPSSFDGLSDGTPKPSNELRARSADPTLDAPRPVSPISVSFVSTLRPTFTWKASPGSTGAVVEVCKTRACDGPEVRRFEVEGETVSVPQDLEAGVWFWRLYGLSKERIGTKPSATWELVARGPAASGSSDAPSGGMVDINGDGLPDLIVSSHGYDIDDADNEVKQWPLTMVWFGQPDGKLSTANGFWMDDGAVHEPALGGGIDTDGDGFTDIVQTLQHRDTGEFHVVVEYGSAGKTVETGAGEHMEYIDWSKYGEVMVPGLKTLPAVREAGDVNGDGFGDVLVGAPNAAVVGLGSAKGTSLSMPLFFETGIGGASTLVGAFDADGDGLSDIALASSNTGSPLAAGRGDRERISIKDDLVARGSGNVEKAIAIATGDFDGDGTIDIAATVPVDGRRNICLWKGTREKLFDFLYCVPSPANDATYGDRLIVGDLSGKGKDNILVSAGQGTSSYVEIFELDGDSLGIDGIDMSGIGGKLTMIWPGRPGKARWATTDGQGTAVLIFEGRKLFQSIPMFGRGGDYTYPVYALR